MVEQRIENLHRSISHRQQEIIELKELLSTLPPEEEDEQASQGND